MTINQWMQDRTGARKIVRWGIAGYGDVVQRRVLPALHELSQAAVCLWGRDPARACTIAQRHGIPRSTTDYEAMLEDIEAVYVATPVAAHVPLALAAVRAGRHVLVEKPLSGALRNGAEGLAAVALQRGVTAGVAYYRRCAPALRRLREILRSTTPCQLRVQFRAAFDPAPTHPMYWRTDLAAAGGGVLTDAGSHRLDLLCWLVGEPSNVSGRLSNRFELGSERAASVVLQWPGGIVADCTLEWADGLASNHLSISFENASVTLDPLDSGRLRWSCRDGEDGEIFPSPKNSHTSLIADFLSSIATGDPPVCPLDQAILVDTIIAAAEESSAHASLFQPISRDLATSPPPNPQGEPVFFDQSGDRVKDE